MFLYNLWFQIRWLMASRLEFIRVPKMLIPRVQQICLSDYARLHDNSICWHLHEFWRPVNRYGRRMHLCWDCRRVLQGDDLPNSSWENHTIAPQNYRQLYRTLQVSQWVKLRSYNQHLDVWDQYGKRIREGSSNFKRNIIVSEHSVFRMSYNFIVDIYLNTCLYIICRCFWLYITYVVFFNVITYKICLPLLGKILSDSRKNG